jgi:hypothetical protein
MESGEYESPGGKVKNPFPDETPEHDIWERIKNAQDNVESYTKYAGDYAQKARIAQLKADAYRFALAKLMRKDPPDGQEPPRPNRGRQDRRDRVRTKDISL